MPHARDGFSALQRAEIAEISTTACIHTNTACFSALQRAEIAEIGSGFGRSMGAILVSVLFNEPKLLKSNKRHFRTNKATSFSALQRAEIAEMNPARIHRVGQIEFQCSSTSRNC